MAIVTFWNDGRVETAQSMNAAAVATTLAINYNYKILIINTKHDDKTLEWAFDSKKNVNTSFTKGKTDIETGIGGVVKAIISNKTSPEIITNYTKIILKNFELLTEKNMDEDDFAKYSSYMLDIIKLANRYYDLVIVDLEGGLDNPKIKAILENSNVIVSTLVQNINVLDRFLDTRNKEAVLRAENVVLSFNKYDEKSKYSLKNISKYLKEKKIVKIPYNTMFGSDAGEGKVADYLIRFKGANQSNVNFQFINSIRAESEAIVDMIKRQQYNKK